MNFDLILAKTVVLLGTALKKSSEIGNSQFPF